MTLIFLPDFTDAYGGLMFTPSVGEPFKVLCQEFNCCATAQFCIFMPNR